MRLDFTGGALSDGLASVERDILAPFYLCAMGLLGFICTWLAEAPPKAAGTVLFRPRHCTEWSLEMVALTVRPAAKPWGHTRWPCGHSLAFLPSVMQVFCLPSPRRLVLCIAGDETAPGTWQGSATDLSGGAAGARPGSPDVSGGGSPAPPPPGSRTHVTEEPCWGSPSPVLVGPAGTCRDLAAPPPSRAQGPG